MKQAQSESSRSYSPGSSPANESLIPISRHRVDPAFDSSIHDLPRQVRSWEEIVLAALDRFLSVVSLPFRLMFSIAAWLGRIAALLLGFTLMVAGTALLAGPLLPVGIPLFLLGLVFTLRCLE
jgi:hypothetical protein